MLSNQTQIIEQAKFAYPPLGKTFEKQTEKQIDALKSYKKDELKQIVGIFQQNLMNYLVWTKLEKSLICKILLKQIS